MQTGGDVHHRVQTVEEPHHRDVQHPVGGVQHHVEGVQHQEGGDLLNGSSADPDEVAGRGLGEAEEGLVDREVCCRRQVEWGPLQEVVEHYRWGEVAGQGRIGEVWDEVDQWRA